MKRAVVACALLSLYVFCPCAPSQDKKLGKRKAAPVEARAKWEYSVLNQDEVIKLGKDDVRAGLNKLGDEGWELVTVAVKTPARSTYYFKRRKGPAPVIATEAKDAKETTSVLRLKHAQAATVVKVLDKLYGGKKGRLASDDRTNSVIVLGTQNQVLELAELLTRLDEPDDAPAKGKGKKP